MFNVRLRFLQFKKKPTTAETNKNSEQSHEICTEHEFNLSYYGDFWLS